MLCLSRVFLMESVNQVAALYSVCCASAVYFSERVCSNGRPTKTGQRKCLELDKSRYQLAAADNRQQQTVWVCAWGGGVPPLSSHGARSHGGGGGGGSASPPGSAHAAAITESLGV